MRKRTSNNSHRQQRSAAKRFGPKSILPPNVTLNYFRRWLRGRYRHRLCKPWLWTEEEAARVIREWKEDHR